MEVNNLLKNELTQLAENIESVIVKYPKEKNVEGKVSESQNDAFRVQILQSDVKNTADKFHEIDFEKAVEIVVYYYNGKISVHADSKYIG